MQKGSVTLQHDQVLFPQLNGPSGCKLCNTTALHALHNVKTTHSIKTNIETLYFSLLHFLQSIPGEFTYLDLLRHSPTDNAALVMQEGTHPFIGFGEVTQDTIHQRRGSSSCFAANIL
jgi:hypothetical protein